MIADKYTVHVTDPGTAADLIHELRQLIILYGAVSVAELQELLGVRTFEDEDDIGWINIPEGVMTPNDDGSVDIELPKPIPLGPKSEKKEAVDHPSHYQSETGLEAWDVIKAFTSDLMGIEAFDTGNVLKYMCRWRNKNGLEDLKKAKRYLEHLIDHVEKLEKEND